jgi:hypothetical protein
VTLASENKSLRLLEQVQAIDLALVELKFYLDVNPKAILALKQKHDLIERRKVIRSLLEAQIGAISSYDVLSEQDDWKWSLAPSPWNN